VDSETSWIQMKRQFLGGSHRFLFTVSRLSGYRVKELAANCLAERVADRSVVWRSPHGEVSWTVSPVEGVSCVSARG